MKNFTVKYERKNNDGFTRYATEVIKANGIMHAHRLAQEHAKVIKHKVHSIHEITGES